jgi:pyruvate,water dikinase
VVDKPREVGSKIVVTYRTDPGWVGVLPSAAALLIERGSPLSHVAIVARELGVPTVVQIPDLTTRVRTGMTLTVDGGQGTVEIAEPTADQ